MDMMRPVILFKICETKSSQNIILFLSTDRSG